MEKSLVDKLVARNPLEFSLLNTSPDVLISKSYFIHIFNDFILVYSRRAGAVHPMGQNFDVNRKALSLCLFVASLKTNAFEV